MILFNRNLIWRRSAMSKTPMEQQFKQTKQKSILVIDDDAEIREVLKYQLAGLGPQIKIYEATEGKEGLDIIHRINPDIVISDYEMPGLSGLELSKILHDEGIKTPVIWVTGRIISRGLESGSL